MLISFIKYVKGCVKISVKGNTARFLDLLFSNEIKYYKLFAKSDNELILEISPTTLKKLIPIRRKTHCRVHILKKSGLFLLVRKFRRRLGLVLGLAFSVTTLWCLSLFVWNVNVSGCETTTKNQVFRLLEENGFKAGMLKRSIDEEVIENNFLKSTDDYSWISINIKGTVAYIEVKEHIRPPDRVDASEPCNIYAARDGVIASITSYMGYPVVAKGDTVTAGDLIVSGNYTDRFGVEFKLHSYAKVMAYTRRTYCVDVPLKRKEHIPTGKTKNKYTLKLLRFNIPLYFNKKISYNTYDMTEKSVQLKLGKNFALPVYLVTKTYTEYSEYMSDVSVDAAVLDAKEQLSDMEYELTGVTVTDRIYDVSQKDGNACVKVTLECYEDIGLPQKIY